MSKPIDFEVLTKDARRVFLAKKADHGLYVDIAGDLGVSKKSVSAVMLGKTRSERIEKALADHFGYARKDLWEVK